MLKELLSNRLFLGGLVFFILTVGGSLFYMQHVERQTAQVLDRTEERIKQRYENQKTMAAAPFAKTPSVVDTSQGGHFHEDGTWHAEPHTTNDTSVMTDEKTNAEKNTIAETQENSSREDLQDALFQKRVQQYHKDYRLWWEEYNRVYAEWQQAKEAVMELRRQAVDENWAESLKSRSEVQIKELHAKVQKLIENEQSARKRATAFWEEKPIFPTQTQE